MSDVTWALKHKKVDVPMFCDMIVQWMASAALPNLGVDAIF